MTAEYVELCHRYLYEQLNDEQWHPLEPLLIQMMKWVPPGVAMRRTKRDRRLERDRRERDGRPVGTIAPAASRQATDYMVRVGARRTAWDIVGASKGPYETKQGADGVALIRLVRTPAVIRGDRARAQQLQPAFDGLADHFTAAGMDYAAEQIQLTAHEYGFHLRTCPEDCSLTRRTREALHHMHIVDENEQQGDNEDPPDDTELSETAAAANGHRPPWTNPDMGINSPEEWERVRAFLAGYRRDKGWPQYEIGHRMHVGQSTVSQLENGKAAPTTALLTRYLRALELPPDFILKDLAPAADRPKAPPTAEPPVCPVCHLVHRGEC